MDPSGKRARLECLQILSITRISKRRSKAKKVKLAKLLAQSEAPRWPWKQS